MLYCIFGMPGSGKSYLLMDKFVVNRPMDNIISNVELANNFTLDSYQYLNKFDLDVLLSNIKGIMLNDTTSHDVKIGELRSLFLLRFSSDPRNITFIVDECHLYGFDGTVGETKWADKFISIHRHILGDKYKLDIVLVTQVVSRLNSRIAEQCEIAVQAVPASRRLFKGNLEYFEYSGVSALKKRDKALRLRTVTVRAKTEIFEMYNSGYVNIGDNAFRKKLVLLVVGIVLVFLFVISRFVSLLAPKNDMLVEENQIIKDKNISFSVISEGNTTIKPYVIKCYNIFGEYAIPPNHIYTLIHGKNKQVCVKKYISMLPKVTNRHKLLNDYHPLLHYA